MTPLFLMATAMQTVQCNAVDNVGMVTPYTVELGMPDGRPALSIRPVDRGIPTVAVANVKSRLPSSPMATFDFDGTIAGVVYKGTWNERFLSKRERMWTLELTGKDGPQRGLTLLHAICGDGFKTARSPAQPPIAGHTLTCYAVMVSGRMFAFTYDFAPGGIGTMTTSDKTLWKAGSATVKATGPRSPDTNGIMMDFSGFDPLPGTDGPVGHKIMFVNTESLIASYQFSFFNIENRESQGGMKQNPAIALCRAFRFASKPGAPPPAP